MGTGTQGVVAANSTYCCFLKCASPSRSYALDVGLPATKNDPVSQSDQSERRPQDLDKGISCKVVLSDYFRHVLLFVKKFCQFGHQCQMPCAQLERSTSWFLHIVNFDPAFARFICQICSVH